MGVLLNAYHFNLDYHGVAPEEENDVTPLLPLLNFGSHFDRIMETLREPTFSMNRYEKLAVIPVGSLIGRLFMYFL